MLETITHKYYETVDSTNERIKELARAGEITEGLVISAGTQTAGKGRVGRKWESPKSESIATSILLHPNEIPISNVPTITIVAAMAVRDALEKTCGLDAKIKWPNDIVVDGKKICGILTEMEAEAGAVKYVVVGIGVNVHNRDFPEEIAYKATSVDLELEKIHGSDENWQADKLQLQAHRKAITYGIWESFKRLYNEFLETGDLTGLREEYEKNLVNRNERVRIEAPDGAYEAYAVGINQRGALIVSKNGEEIVIDSGEVSVRGIFGYV